MVDTVAVEVPASDVRAEVDRILASRGFANAGRLSRLLTYVVEKTLANETDQLKEYAVGVEVFERGEHYDPRLDSIVRVEAGRLRSRLDEYYNGEGAASTIRVSLPRGGYSAQFVRRNHSPVSPPAEQSAVPPAAARRSRAAAPVAAGLVVAVAALVIWLSGWNSAAPADTRPAVAVLAFEASMPGPDSERLAPRLTEAVTTELARLGTLSVASYTSASQFRSERRSVQEIGSALNVGFVLEASIDDEGAGILVVVRLVNAVTDRKVWVSDYRGDRSDVRGLSSRIALEASTAVLRAAKQ